MFQVSSLVLNAGYTPVATNAAWIGWSSGLLNHSTVMTSWPSIWAASIQSVLVSLPSIKTAPAPVSPESERSGRLSFRVDVVVAVKFREVLFGFYFVRLRKKFSCL